MPEIIRGSRPRGSDESPPRSLYNRITVDDLGSRLTREAPKRIDRLEQVGAPETATGPSTLDHVFGFVRNLLPDVSYDVVRAASESAIAILQDRTASEETKKNDLDDLFEPLSSTQFNEIYSLVQRLPEAPENGQFTEEQVAPPDDEQDLLDEIVDDSDADSDIVERPSAQRPSAQRTPEMTKPQETLITNSRVSPVDIKAQWLQQKLSPTGVPLKKVMKALEAGPQAEAALLDLFNNENLDLIRTLVQNRDAVYWLTRFYRAETGLEREDIQQQIISEGFGHLLNANGQGIMKDDLRRIPQILDLDASLFGGRRAVATKVQLPEGSTRIVKRSYEQYNVPYPHREPTVNETPLRNISDLPEWAQLAFPGISQLNRVQSHVFPAVFESDVNILLSAPTGAGKTNVALLAILRTLQEYRLPSGEFDTANFKIVYISPLKALVQEQVREFTRRLGPLGIRVEELSGDRGLTGEQIASTQMIITTPEKWDVVTRKSSEARYTALVRLIVIDEIHLLNDTRGPVLENIVARSLNPATTNENRVIGLSATLSNYQDVATFLGAEGGTFYFDPTYRPVPLSQVYVGVTEKNAMKRLQAMNNVCYEKTIEYIREHQVIVFVHSRKETFKTAQLIHNRAVEEGHADVFTSAEQASGPGLENVENLGLKDLLAKGVGAHHAGLSRHDRALVERAFLDGKIKVLVSTATLAWGVNLPAHAVIIKGTEVYNPEAGSWEELSPQDVLQMLGRAGRPGFDTYGEGVVITRHTELDYYMSIMGSQFPIESQMMARLTDSLNAECNLGLIRTLQDGVLWLQRTYLHVRMGNNPNMYRTGLDYDEEHRLLFHEEDLVHSALVLLNQNGLIRYNLDTFQITPTEMGRIAASFYISPTSMAIYVEQLKPYMGVVDILRVFAKSEEFRYVQVRAEEKLELAKLADMTPIPIKEPADHPVAKIIVLLQAYISRLSLSGFAVSADMVFISQSASRIFRAMFEIALEQKWAHLTVTLLELFKSVDKRLWPTSSPFRQFPSVPAEIIRRTENSQIPFERYFDLETASEVGEAIRSERHGAEILRLLQKFPRFELDVQYQPLTPTLLRLSIEIEALFTWDVSVHGRSEAFLILVQDSDGEVILASEWLRFSRNSIQRPRVLDYTVSLIEPLAPAYFVTLLSDKWLHSRSQTIVSFTKLRLPEKYSSPMMLRHVPKVSVESPSLAGVHFSHTELNPIQSFLYESLSDTDANLFVGMAYGNGRAFCTEILINAHLKRSKELIVILEPFQEQVDRSFERWASSIPTISKLTGIISEDLQRIASSRVVIATAAQWEFICHRWQQRPVLHRVQLLVCSDIHLIGASKGHVIELAIMRTKLMAAQTGMNTRFVGFGIPIADSRDIGEWLGADKRGILNISPLERIVPIDIRVAAFTDAGHDARLYAMTRPVLEELDDPARSATVFVSDRRECLRMGYHLSRVAEAMGSRVFLNEGVDSQLRFKDTSLAKLALRGVYFLAAEMDPTDIEAVLSLNPRVLLIARDFMRIAPRRTLVIVMGTSFFDPREDRVIDYTAAEVIQMTGLATERAVLFTSQLKREYYAKFLSEPLPVESHLNYFLSDGLLPDIGSGAVSSGEEVLDWLTYSFFFRRLRKNPSFYDLEGTTEDEINEHLSELVENTVEELSANGFVELVDDESVVFTSRNETLIASIYNLSIKTMKSLLGLSARSAVREILEALCTTPEFDEIAVETSDLAQIHRLESQLMFRYRKNDAATDSEYLPNMKAFVLIQSYISRLKLPATFSHDTQKAVSIALRLVEALIDLWGSEGHLGTLVLVDLHQMLTQAVWDKDSRLRQIPHFTEEIIERSVAAGINSVNDFISIEESDVRNSILGFNEEDPRMVEIAQFVNKFPSVDIAAHVDGVLTAGEFGQIRVNIEREIDEEDTLEVIAPLLKEPRDEQWYLIVGSVERREIYGLRKLRLVEEQQTISVNVSVPEAGELDLIVWCLCDSYLDADKETRIRVVVE